MGKKVIREGSPIVQKEWKFECDECGCIWTDDNDGKNPGPNIAVASGCPMCTKVEVAKWVMEWTMDSEYGILKGYTPPEGASIIDGGI